MDGQQDANDLHPIDTANELLVDDALIAIRRVLESKNVFIKLPSASAVQHGLQREDARDIVLCTSRLPSYLPGGGWPRCRSARAFLGPQLVEL